MRRISHRCIISRTFRRISFRVDIYVPPISPRVCKNTARSKGQGQQNKHRRFLERSNEVTPFHPASRLKPSGRKFMHAAGKVGGLWLVRSHSSCLFHTGQSLLVDFGLCASTRLVFFTLVSRCWWTLACALPLFLSFLTLVSRCWWTLACAFPRVRHLPLCDMRGDIDHNVTCMKTLTAMRHVWIHLPLCDMYGDVHRHVICDMCGDIYLCVICTETFDTMWYAWRH